MSSACGIKSRIRYESECFIFKDSQMAILPRFGDFLWIPQIHKNTFYWSYIEHS